MMLAAGDVPDYGFYYTTGRYLNEQGLGRTIPLEIIKQSYPGYYKLLTDDPIGLAFNKVPDKDEYYSLTSVTVMNTHTGHVPMWRLDWLEDLGYEMENLTPMDSAVNDEWDNKLFFSNTKFTEDDVREILRAFTEDDPDGNGVDDTYGSAFSNTVYDCYISYCMFGFDRDANHFYKDPNTGDYVPYYAYSSYKAMFKFLTEMIDKGYIRWVAGVESYLNELKSTWATGKTGYMNILSGPRVFGYNADVNEWPPASVLSVDSDALFVVTPTPISGKYRPYWTFNWNAAHTYPIGINCDDDKMVRLFQLLDYAYFGDDWLKYKWGIEGIHYTWASEPFNSPMIVTDRETIPPKYTMSGFFSNTHFVTDYKVYWSYDAFSVQFYDFWEKYNKGGFKDDSLWIRPDKYYSDYTMPEDKHKEFTELKTATENEINTVHNDFASKVWAGQIANIDTEWEQYIDQIYAAGLKDWVAIWNSEDIQTYQYYNSLK